MNLIYYTSSSNTKSSIQTETELSLDVNMNIIDPPYDETQTSHGLQTVENDIKNSLLDDNSIVLHYDDDSEYNRNNITNDIPFCDTCSTTNTTNTSNYVPCIFEGNVQTELTLEEQQFYLKIDSQKRVFIASDNVGEIYDLYVCEILEIKITTDKYVYYLLKYDKSEAGKKRDPFWLPQWRVVHQDNYGRSLHTSGRTLSKRTSLPTKRYFDESSDITEYHAKRKEFENIMVVCGANNESQSKKLCEICDLIYDQVESNNMTVLAGYGCWLSDYHVMSVLTHYSMRNPDLDKYHRKKIKIYGGVKASKNTSYVGMQVITYRIYVSAAIHVVISFKAHQHYWNLNDYKKKS